MGGNAQFENKLGKQIPPKVGKFGIIVRKYSTPLLSGSLLRLSSPLLSPPPPSSPLPPPPLPSSPLLSSPPLARSFPRKPPFKSSSAKSFNRSVTGRLIVAGEIGQKSARLGWRFGG